MFGTYVYSVIHHLMFITTHCMVLTPWLLLVLQRIKLAEEIPEAPYGFPFFGHALHLGFRCPWDVITEWALGSEGRKGLGYLFRMRMFNTDCLVISSPGLVKEVGVPSRCYVYHILGVLT